MEDPRQFNIENGQGLLLCPSCGFPGYSDKPAYDERGGIVGTTICSCCLWEPGFDDDQLASVNAGDTILQSLKNYRAKLGTLQLGQGGRDRRPKDFNVERQLSVLFAIAPHVR
ncbi:hypothetical protein [Sandaracinobacteroides saxicola]|uniref:Uncharacterized protein n=1 Tax=Sandaracinobacteroides saxicola TaxID=2759707 RepID=A0A7G5IEL4_9SPHN|nr:hypothetical protein [Sandaracinobacteroides saxicola]QMW21806.1 hypothetical protein H3309_10405 [Sandaracinobacteroides saxicola]